MVGFTRSMKSIFHISKYLNESDFLFYRLTPTLRFNLTGQFFCGQAKIIAKLIIVVVFVKILFNYPEVTCGPVLIFRRNKLISAP